jgi:phosphatidylglycerol:prolipoprotein diacylglycerol transferase
MAMSVAEACWVAALLAGIGFVIYAAPSCGLDRPIAYWACLSALIGGLIGGSLLGLLDYGLDDHTWNLAARGKSFCGGLAGGAVAAAFFLAWRKVTIAKYGDLLVTALALAYAIGRIGCFFNGCDYGIVTRLPWSVRYPLGTEAYADHLERGWITPDQALSLPVHPVQLYAAGVGLVMFLVLWRWKTTWPGQRIWLFALMYGVYRFSVEWWRGDFRTLVGPFSLPQIVGILLVVGALGVSCCRRCLARPCRLNSIDDLMPGTAKNEHLVAR